MLQHDIPVGAMATQSLVFLPQSAQVAANTYIKHNLDYRGCGTGDVAAERQSERGHLQEAAGAHRWSCNHQPSAAAARWDAQRGHMHGTSVRLLVTQQSQGQHTPPRCLLSGIASGAQDRLVSRISFACAQLTYNAVWQT